jgi:hypothetical protein
MNSHNLETQLHEIFAKYHAPQERYRNLAFSSKDTSIVEKLATAIKNCLPNYAVWNGFQPCDNAPSSQCSRFDFIEHTFCQPTGLIVLYPDEWLRHWAIQDQQAFWSALSTHHGGHNIVVVFNQAHDFTSQNNHYFLPLELQNVAITLWISSKTPLSH